MVDGKKLMGWLKYFPNSTTEFPPKYKLDVFRIIQEIVQNAIKHSSATKFLIKIKVHNQQATILTGDNGNGFEYSKVSKGKGLENILNRIVYMNGEFKMCSILNKGTVMVIKIS